MHVPRNARRFDATMRRDSIAVVVCIGACLLMFWVTVLRQIGPFSIPIGGDATTMRRGLDEPYLYGFWPPEPDNWNPAVQAAYRWSTPRWQISWPMAGRGLFVSTTAIDASAWAPHAGVALTWEEPALTNVAPLRERRILSVLTKGDGVRAHISVSSSPLPVTDDRRELGVIVSQSSLQPLIGTWRPVQLIMGVLVIGGLWAALTAWHARHRLLYVAGGILLYSIGWLSDPLWWLVHSQAMGISAAIACLSAFALVHLILPESKDKLRWWWVTALTIAVPLVALRSPFLHTSDSAMHVRMLFDIMRGNLFQIAELPCEAGALTVPYPPLVYILAAPFALLTWDRQTGINLLMSGAVIVHVGALLYVYRVARNTSSCDWTAAVYLLLAAWSMPFLQSVHIGELSNAWGHAVLLVAVVAWYDTRASWGLRTILGTAALLTHTGIALSFGLTLLTILGYTGIRTRRIPRDMLFAGLCMVLIALVLTYSGYAGLVGQPAKYPGCPPGIAWTAKFSQIPTALPFVLVCLGGMGLLGMRRSRIADIVIPALVVAVLCVGVLLFRDQTVRWAMVVYPFLALIATAALARLSARSPAAKVLALTLGIGVPLVVIVRFWERVYTYLH